MTTTRSKAVRTSLGSQVEFRKGYAFKSGWYTDVGHPIVKVSNFTDSSVDPSNLVFIPPEIAQNHLKYQLEANDVVIQTVGSWPTNPDSVVGKVIRIPSDVCGALLNQNAVKLVPCSAIDRRFLFYRLKSPDFKSYIVGTAQGAASQAAITLESIRAFAFVLPDYESQRRRAAILSAYDDLIENNTRRIKILEEMAKMIYREWFVNFRFPGHEKVSLVDGEAGQIPAGWKTELLENVCQRITDGSHWSPKGTKEGLPMASVKDMHNWGLDLSRCRKISCEDFATLVRNDCQPLMGDVLIAKDGSYLKHCFWVQKAMDVVILSSIAILRPNSKIRPSYLSLHLLDPQIKSRMAGYVSGVALPRIILKNFRKFSVLVPPPPIQEAFSHSVEPMLQLCWSLTRQNSILRQARDLLLPKLISGEVSVEKFKAEAVAQGL